MSDHPTLSKAEAKRHVRALVAAYLADEFVQYLFCRNDGTVIAGGNGALRVDPASTMPLLEAVEELRIEVGRHGRFYPAPSAPKQPTADMED